MYYVKKLDENGEVEALITYDRKPVLKNELSVEITEEEYNSLSAELEAQWAAESASSETIPYTDIGEG